MPKNEEASVVNQVQNVVHGSTCTLVVPGILSLLSMVLLFYRGVTQEHTDLPLNGFLANILIQMCPLAALKWKLWSCSDRVSLVPLVLCKTLLMHVIVGVFRVASQTLDGMIYGKLVFAADSTMLIMACLILKYEFEFSLNPMTWIVHTDVRNLTILSCVAALVTEVGFEISPSSKWSDETRSFFANPLVPSKVLFTAANYVDIIAVMPLVWRLYQAEAEHDDYNIGTTVSSTAKRQAQFFFFFLFCFYAWDDVIDPVLSLLDEPLAMMAHAAHFILVLDFAGFFLFQVQQPSTTQSPSGMERGEQLQGLLSAPDDDDPY